ncbi:MAG: ARMT1-like domain-containing protein [Nitrospiraceae bacterium]|nr:ARMT1-like domain-containing protein [Nitrospiraceae bacterium]
MKVQLDCFPCFLRQVVIALRLCTKDKELEERVIKSVLPEVERTDMSKSPAHTTTFIHRKIRQMLGTDPFREVKHEYNEHALGLYPSLMDRIKNSPDPLLTSARLAIAGNIIDFGIFSSVDIESTVERALNGPIEADDYPAFRKAVDASHDILYLADNAGEIVFDRMLIETLNGFGKCVTVAVKGSPVLNDATIEDAGQAGITGLCEVVDNGSDCIGTILDMTSKEFNRIFDNSGLVISKGQGNFETLMNERREKIFFLFQSKCDVVSRELGVPLKSMLLKEHGEKNPLKKGL